MNRFYILISFLFFTAGCFAQMKEQKLYSYLKQRVNYELKDNDSIVIDQFSEKDEKYNWQAIIKREDTNYIVTFLPPQYLQDTMILPLELNIINVYKTTRAELVSAFEQAKIDLISRKLPLKIPVEVAVRHQGKSKRFDLNKAQELFYLLRYNKSSDGVGE